jgi:ribosomal 30S subunit maturation factor RimM
VILTVALAACQSGEGSQDSATPATTAAAAATTPGATQASGTVTPARQKPPQTNAAAIRPAERRDELTRLTNLLHFQVTTQDGQSLGKVADYIVNTCETYLIYMVMDPAPELDIASGQRLVIPFEAVTINSGALDAEAKAIVLDLAPEQLASAPAFPDRLPLFPLTWEDSVRSYWQQVVRVGPLHSECKAGGSDSANAVHKIAYATQLLGTTLKDGNQNVLGSVEEAILEPESGKLGYYVVDLQGGQGLVMVPLGKTNIPESALQPGATVELVLLAEANQLLGAPRMGSLEDAATNDAQGAARKYWGQ